MTEVSFPAPQKSMDCGLCKCYQICR